MSLTLIMTSLCLGTGAACAAVKVPAHAAAFERLAGVLLVAGLAMLGLALGSVGCGM